MAPPARKTPLQTPRTVSRTTSTLAKTRRTVPPKTPQRTQTKRSSRSHHADPFTQQLDLATMAGMRIDAESVIEDVQSANQTAMAHIADSSYSSDDDLSGCEAKQAEKLRREIADRLTEIGKQLHEQWLKDNERDYSENGSVLDQEIVGRKLAELRMFAEHLRKAGKNRAGLLARIAEPLAEDHWLVEPEFHQQFVDTFRTISNLVSNLPRIAEAASAASHSSEFLELKAAEGEEQTRMRQIAQIEKLIHQVEQANEWLESDAQDRFVLTSFVSDSAQ